MSRQAAPCPDCETSDSAVDRRDFLRTAGGTAAAAAWATTCTGRSAAAESAGPTAAPETVVKLLYDSLNAKQRQAICFDWDYEQGERGLLRSRVANNWQVTPHAIESDFFTAPQRRMIRDIYEGIIHPDWHARIDKQLKDDTGGWGRRQSVAVFGVPGDAKFEFVMTGRHMTLRCDGNSADHVAFGGPIFYGHAASGFYEKPDHSGNVFWPQAVAANELFDMLDGQQRTRALADHAPAESRVGFRGPAGMFTGIVIADLSPDQREKAQQVLQTLLEPYRQSDRDEVVACLKAQGGLDRCHLTFYRNPDLGDDQLWDVWRLEGPAFVWHFRGAPHVHVWVNVASDPSVPLNA